MALENRPSKKKVIQSKKQNIQTEKKNNQAKKQNIQTEKKNNQAEKQTFRPKRKTIRPDDLREKYIAGNETNMLNQFSRTQLVYGEEAMKKFASCRVAVFGIGGVGGYVVEALARSGIGALDLIDDDKVCLSNLNRQIIATRSTVGQYKVDVAKERILDINPDCVVRTYKTFFLPQTQDLFDFRQYDYVVDAIDTVTGKIAIVELSKNAGVPVISSMGAGNKVNASLFEVADIYKTSVCPLAKVMRHECRKRGIQSLKVVYSKEVPRRPLEDMSGSVSENGQCTSGSVSGDGGRTSEGGIENGSRDSGSVREGFERRSIPGSTAFVPSVAGLIIAGEIINDLAASVQTQKDMG